MAPLSVLYSEGESPINSGTGKESQNPHMWGRCPLSQMGSRPEIFYDAHSRLSSEAEEDGLDWTLRTWAYLAAAPPCGPP
ncbi:hypothetical protein JRQ81_009468 [Phrynocephalus forsythii]|uniref:Uncharacterized protein n=1 Tax=Phrynocephalus forsythii TaxID=171643 RepID=A0A9Q0X9W7_9SAUR|nr:hypothetical protein JRQ81_009468 [Phrynocephalus forsythii]